MAADPSALLNTLSNLADAAHQLVRALAAQARGPARQALADAAYLDPDTNGQGCIVALHASIAASNGGMNVPFDTNPDYDLAVHALRGAVEVGTAENTANNGGASYNAAHCSFRLHDPNRTKSITYGENPAAGGTTRSGFIDMMLLGANERPGLELKVPYMFRGDKGTSQVIGVFATDASWPGTRRVGVALTCTYRRRGNARAAV